MNTQYGTSVSLRTRLTQRLALGLLLVGLAGTIAAYQFAAQYAHLIYDRTQADDVITMAKQISIKEGRVQVNLPDAALVWFMADEGEQVYYRISDLRSGTTVTGNWDFGLLDTSFHYTDQIEFSDAFAGLRHMRVGRVLYTVEPGGVPVLIELGETTGKRDRVRSAILTMTIVFMITIITVAVGLAWREVRQAFRPLQVIEEEVARRSSNDLAPLDASRAPAEVRGLIVAFNDMMGRVSTAMTAQNNFIANAAHQLRTPLSGLRLQAQLALKAGNSESLKACLLDIEACASRTSHLVEQLLVLAKAEAPPMEGDLQSVDLEAVAYEVIERYLAQADQLGADLGFESDGTPCRVMANPILLGELLGNLVDNAIRYGGRNITISACVDGNDALLVVSDDGQGFASAEASRAFERFYRSDSAGRSGVGLGLAIVREVADRYLGKLSLHSEPGRGCRFEVRFPRSINLL